MKTTLNFDDRLFRAANAHAAEEGETLTRLIERDLRDYLQALRALGDPYRADLQTKRGRPVAGVNLDDRDMLYERMDARDRLRSTPTSSSTHIAKSRPGTPLPTRESWDSPSLPHLGGFRPSASVSSSVS